MPTMKGTIFIVISLACIYLTGAQQTTSKEQCERTCENIYPNYLTQCKNLCVNLDTEAELDAEKLRADSKTSKLCRQNCELQRRNTILNNLNINQIQQQADRTYETCMQRNCRVTPPVATGDAGPECLKQCAQNRYEETLKGTDITTINTQFSICLTTCAAKQGARMVGYDCLDRCELQKQQYNQQGVLPNQMHTLFMTCIGACASAGDKLTFGAAGFVCVKTCATTRLNQEISTNWRINWLAFGRSFAACINACPKKTVTTTAVKTDCQRNCDARRQAYLNQNIAIIDVNNFYAQCNNKCAGVAVTVGGSSSTANGCSCRNWATTVLNQYEGTNEISAEALVKLRQRVSLACGTVKWEYPTQFITQ